MDWYTLLWVGLLLFMLFTCGRMAFMGMGRRRHRTGSKTREPGAGTDLHA